MPFVVCFLYQTPAISGLVAIRAVKWRHVSKLVLPPTASRPPPDPPPPPCLCLHRRTPAANPRKGRDKSRVQTQWRPHTPTQAEPVRDEAPPPEDLLALTVPGRQHTDAFFCFFLLLEGHVVCLFCYCFYWFACLSNLGGGCPPARPPACLSFCWTGAEEPLY